MLHRHALLLLYLLICFSALVSAVLFNVTVDDNTADPVSGSRIIYSANWNYGPDCSRCEAQLDAEQVYMETWHDATSRPPSAPQNATFTFTGNNHSMLGTELLK